MESTKNESDGGTILKKDRRSNVETIIYAFLTSFWWMSSASILLPLVFVLKVSSRFQNFWFAWIFTTCVKYVVGRHMLPLRKRCFELLEKQLVSRDVTRPLRIVEIGIGDGANLSLYPPNSTLVAIDTNSTFQSYFHENRQKFPQVTLEAAILGKAEDMDELQDDSVDVVISTYVLCSVQDVRKVLEQIRRILKPGGHFLFLEHVAFPEKEWNFTIQQMAGPLWSLYFAGCCCHRQLQTEIDGAGFTSINCNTHEAPSMNFFVRPHLIGIATK